MKTQKSNPTYYFYKPRIYKSINGWSVIANLTTPEDIHEKAREFASFLNRRERMGYYMNLDA